MKVYTYVVAYNGGSAPNYQSPIVTLAICKPKIRECARIGDLVIGFQRTQKGISPHGVIWAGLVSEKLTFEDYWNDKRFSGKRPMSPGGKPNNQSDNIYAPSVGQPIQIKNCVHDERNMATDLGGKFVLVFEKSWVFKQPNTGYAPVIPDELNLRMVGPNRRGHRVKNSNVDDLDTSAVIAWLNSEKRNFAAGEDNEPGTSIKRGRC